MGRSEREAVMAMNTGFRRSRVRASGRRSGAGRVCVAAIALIAGCGCAGPGSYFLPARSEHAGARQLAQVVMIGRREDIVGLGDDYQRLLAAGIPDSALVDGSVAVGRIFCCGGMNGLVESTNQLRFHVPDGMSLSLYDVVELELGREARRGDPGAVNRAVRVRDRHDDPDNPCRWLPDRDGLWLRVLHCDSLEAQGWVHKDGIGHPWFKLPTGAMTHR